MWWFSACSARRLFVVGASCSVFRAYSSSSSSSATATTATGGGSHYETLGVKPNATQAEIRQARRDTKALKAERHEFDAGTDRRV